MMEMMGTTGTTGTMGTMTMMTMIRVREVERRARRLPSSNQYDKILEKLDDYKVPKLNLGRQYEFSVDCVSHRLTSDMEDLYILVTQRIEIVMFLNVALRCATGEPYVSTRYSNHRNSTVETRHIIPKLIPS